MSCRRRIWKAMAISRPTPMAKKLVWRRAYPRLTSCSQPKNHISRPQMMPTGSPMAIRLTIKRS
ncbi:hypothetical protein D3C75_1132090 [compost metagenome]